MGKAFAPLLSSNSPHYQQMRTIAPRLRKSFVAQVVVLAMLTPGLMTFPVSLNANPRGGQVVHGNVNWANNGKTLNINNSSNSAIINWQSFSIQADEITRINQGAGAVTLNRVVAGNPSEIYGQLRAARGDVLLINPNGIMVGPGGVIDVQGMLTLSTLDITNDDFLNGGSNRFRGNSGAGIVNYGSIVSESGDVVMLGNFLRNASEGSVTAPDGNVVFGAGGDIIVNQTVSGSTISVVGGGPGGEKGIENDGTISGAGAELKAHGNVYALAIKNDGVVRANGYNFSGGKLTLSAGSRGSVVNTGQLYAQNRDGSGGQISVSGGNVTLGNNSVVDASGDAGMAGGQVSVSGRNVSVASTASVSAGGSTGGSVSIIGSNSATVNGSIDTVGSSAAGGNVDVTASSVTVGSTATIDASGVSSGGEVRIGGGIQGSDSTIANSDSTTVEEGSVILADATGGNAGTVVIWSDGDTMYNGQVSAQALGNVGNGGFVEVSGLNTLAFFGSASTAAANGKTGRLLLDPTNVVIGPGGGATMSDTALVNAVLNNNVVIHTASANTEDGDITIQSGSNVVYDSPNSLAFFAHGSIFVNGDVKNHGTTDAAGTGNITLVAGWDGTGASNFGFDPDNTGAGSSGPSVSATEVLSGDYGEWGTGGGSVYLNDAALEPVEVGSARGETNAFGFNVDLRGGNGGGEFTQLGYRRENDIRGMVLQADANPFAIYTGMDGLATAVTIQADFAGAGPIQLIADAYADTDADNAFTAGEEVDMTLNELIDSWNAQNPGNTITLTSGDGTQVVDRFTPIVFSNTVNTTTVDQETGVTGNINVNAKQDVLLAPNSNTSNEEGVKSTDRVYVMIGHGGQRDSNDDVDDRAGQFFEVQLEANMPADPMNPWPASRVTVASSDDWGSDSGTTTVGDGDNSGDIVVNAGRAVIMTGARAESFVQIGHGARAGSGTTGHNFNANNTGEINRGTYDGHVAHTSNSVNGDLSGNISVTGGVIDVEAGFYNQSYAMIGHGGMRARGDHRGDISVTATVGGIIAEAAPDSAIGGPANSNDWRWRNNRDQSFVQFGHGGFDSDYANNDILPRRTVTLDTTSGLAQSVANSSVAGDGIAINPDTGMAYGHGGDITVTSAGGIEFRAANGTDAYAMVGHGGRSTQGDHFGDVTVIAQNGDIIFDRDADQINERGRDITNRGQRAHVQIGHGGTRYVGGSTGDIYVSATGDIEFYAGRSESYAMVGHGGRGEDGSTWSGGRQRNNQANGTHSGDITVLAGGDITFRSGFGNNSSHSFSQIGHGGYFQQADIVDPLGLTNGALIGGGAIDESETGHHGDITVTAGGSISFKAGADTLREGQTFFEANARDAWTMVGHGGYFSKGDHYGQIDVNAGGDMEFEARGGWDAVTIENNASDNNTNTLGTPRLNSTEDNGRSGYRNFATIGHGGVDSTHNNNNPTQNWNNSGAEGDGLGLDYGDGVSDIDITVGGDFRLYGAMKDTNQIPIPVRIIQDNGAGNPNIGAVLNTYLLEDGTTPATPGQGFSQFYGRLVTVDRANGETWTMPDPVMSAEDSYAQIGHGGRSGDYRGGVDGEGHRGNITINVGGDFDARAGDIQQAVSTGQELTITVENYQGVDGMGGSDPAVGMGTLGGAGEYYVGPGINSAGSGNFINGDNSQDDPSQGQRQYLHIGLGGWAARGDHVGDIVINVGGNMDVIAGEGRESYAQVGNGGFDADGSNDNNARNGDTGNTGAITIDIGGYLNLLAGGRDADVVSEWGTDVTSLIDNDNARGTSARIGHGGYATGGSHSGNISVRTGSDIMMIGGTNPRGSDSQIGHGGYAARGESHSGDIFVYSESGNITLQGGTSVEDTGSTQGGGLDNTGHISSGRRSNAQIGHGGWDSDPQGGNQNNAPGVGGNTGNIDVIAKRGNISILGGGNGMITANTNRFEGMYAMVGHGGYATDGDMTGDINVSAGGNVVLTGGEAARDPWAQIGHGGYASSGNHSGIIDVEAGGSVILTRGTGEFNPWAKIGHGAQAFGGRNNNGSGNRNGDIFVSAGLNFDSVGGLVGHVDPLNVGDLFAYDEGSTFIAVSRNNPFAGGPGSFITDSTTVLASSGFGVGSELRLYMPDSGANQIAEGTFINSGEYTRTPTPDGTRNDENIATEHTFTTGAYGELEGTFTPEGAYPTNSFGLYNIYYAGPDPDAVVDPPTLPPTLPPVIDPGFGFNDFLFDAFFDQFGRDDLFFSFDGFTFLDTSLSRDEALLVDPSFLLMSFIIENRFEGAAQTILSEDELQKEKERRKRRAGRKVGKSGLVYYAFDPSTNRYSSYRLFGLPQEDLAPAQ